MPFGDLICRLMNEKDMTIADLSTKMKKYNENMDKSYISKILSGKNIPSDKKIKALAKAFDYNYDLLILEKYFDDAPEPIKNVLDIIFVNAIRNIEKNWCSVVGKNGRSKYHRLSKKEIIQQLKHTPRNEMIVLINNTINKQNKYETIYEEITLNDKQLNLKLPLTLGLPIQDDGLAPMGIKKNCTVTLKLQSNYNNNDIVLIRMIKTNINVARIVYNIGQDIYLIALQGENSELYNDKKHVILGKIIHYNTFLL